MNEMNAGRVGRPSVVSHGEGKIEPFSGKAVVKGMTAPYGLADPTFMIEFAQNFLQGLSDAACYQEIMSGKAARGFDVPRGPQKGSTAVVKPLLGDSIVKLTYLRDQGKVLVELVSRDTKPTMSVEVNATEVTSRGFDLRNVDTNHGKILSPKLTSYLWGLVQPAETEGAPQKK